MRWIWLLFNNLQQNENKIQLCTKTDYAHSTHKASNKSLSIACCVHYSCRPSQIEHTWPEGRTLFYQRGKGHQKSCFLWDANCWLLKLRKILFLRHVSGGPNLWHKTKSRINCNCWFGRNKQEGSRLKSSLTLLGQLNCSAQLGGNCAEPAQIVY